MYLDNLSVSGVDNLLEHADGVMAETLRALAKAGWITAEQAVEFQNGHAVIAVTNSPRWQRYLKLNNSSVSDTSIIYKIVPIA